LWAGGAVSHHGRHFAFDNIDLRTVVSPGERAARMQRGGPPILISGRKEPAMRRAARVGDGFMPYLVSANAYARAAATIREEAAALGRDLSRFQWMLYLYCSIRRDADRARADVAKFLGSAYGDKPQEMLDRIAPSGTPEQVASYIQAYVDAGVRHIIISPAAPSDTLEVVSLAAREVLPRLRLPQSEAVRL
jgi:alkanesulfonate monooxygenase SsuD/methylene tetrahydromethanopterin reductase-like flavin-dependent oxidoreductase (luciferase family)